jgi:hypothetical protein
MKKLVLAIMAALMTLTLVSAIPINAYSPRNCKGLDIYFYETPDLAFAAMLACEVDFIQWSLTYEQWETACATPDLQLAGYAENGMMEFDLNNNYTIADTGDIRNPMHDVEFRKAIANMVDKDWIVNTVISGFAQRINCPLCAPQAGYGDACCDDSNPTWAYDIAAANARLDAAGYLDHDGDGCRNYPLAWDMGTSGIDPATSAGNLWMKMCIRSDHGHRLTAGRELRRVMEEDCDICTSGAAFEASSDVLYPIVMDDRNYHVYTGGWNLGRRPTYVYGLFHSDNWFEGGSNYVTGMNISNLPNYPELDGYAYTAYYPTTIPEFQDAVRNFTALFCELVPNIPLWSYSSWWAYKKTLVGIVNMEGYGLENTYTFLNAKKCDDPATPEDESQDPIRMGTIHAPKDLNQLYSTWYYDYAVMDRVFGGLIAVNPYNLAVDNPWAALDWESTIWYDPQDDENKTLVTYWLRDDVWFHDPETGLDTYKLTTEDIDFMIWYNLAWEDSWIWGGFRDVHHTVIKSACEIEVYFDLQSLWAVYNPTGPLMPFAGMAPLILTTTWCNYTVIDPIAPSDKIVLDGCPGIVKIIGVTSDLQGPLIEGVHFEVFNTGPPDYDHKEIHFLVPVDAGDTIRFHYYEGESIDAHGYYLADLDWTLTWFSTGPYYPIEIVPGVGGRAILNCVNSHFFGAPPEGEIDWVWYYEGTTKPRSGYLKVDLFDAVQLLKAYCSRGDVCPTPTNWFPGADIDCYDLCHVGLYDAVMLLTNYGARWPPRSESC